MDAIFSSEAPVRPPEDLAAEGMWRIAAGRAGMSFPRTRKNGGAGAPCSPSENGLEASGCRYDGGQTALLATAR
jgi:hypothetical protein